MSGSWIERAMLITPGGVHSPVRAFKSVNRPPLFFERAEGPYLFDTDGNSYIDFCSSFGPHLLGHQPKPVLDALQKQLNKGMSYGACHPGEVELSSLLLKSYSFLDQVRLVSSGTEAVMTALRIARGTTGRNKILKFEGCYHGHSDSMLVKSGSGCAELSEASSKGIAPSQVEDTLVCRYDNLSEISAFIEKYGSQIAAIIFEPIPANHGLWIPPQGHVEKIVKLARQKKILIIFDEVITGFRLAAAGASEILDLKPDLVTLGKIIGGGLPLAAVAGKKECMKNLAPLGQVYQAGTLSGNPLACAAGSAVLKEIYRSNPYPKLAEKTDWFVRTLNKKTSAKIQAVQMGSLFWLHFEKPSSAFPMTLSKEACQSYTHFFNKALEKGIYLPPSPHEVCFVSTAHSEDILSSAAEKLSQCLD